MVLVERADATLGYVMAFRRAGPGIRPFHLDSMAEAAADPRFTLPAAAFEVPLASTVTKVARHHFENFHPGEGQVSPLGVGATWGHVGAHASPVDYSRGLYVKVQPAGRAPQCGRLGLRGCVARQVYGADDLTTVYVGRWCNEAACWSQLVYVGARNTVVARAEAGLGWRPRNEKRLIDLVLDPRLQ